MWSRTCRVPRIRLNCGPNPEQRRISETLRSTRVSNRHSRRVPAAAGPAKIRPRPNWRRGTGGREPVWCSARRWAPQWTRRTSAARSVGGRGRWLGRAGRRRRQRERALATRRLPAPVELPRYVRGRLTATRGRGCPRRSRYPVPRTTRPARVTRLRALEGERDPKRRGPVDPLQPECSQLENRPR